MNITLQGLYPITDPQLFDNLEHMLLNVEIALSHGATTIQYRNKSAPAEQRLAEARALKSLCDRYAKPLIINDYLELALELKCGIHLGQDDTSVQEARHTLGNNAIIGATCKNSLSLAGDAIANGADYIAFGAFFPSTTKENTTPASLNTLIQARKLWPDITIVAIGGITPLNCTSILSNGANMIAVVQSLWGSQEIKSTCLQFKDAISHCTIAV